MSVGLASRQVIVVGGGIMGATSAWALAREGVEVLVLDAGRIGGGMTGKSGAIIRCHYSNPEVVRMAVHSRETYRQLPLHLDCEPVYHRTGWLFLVDESEAAQAVANAEMQDQEGLDSVDVEDLQEVLPGIDETGIAYAMFEPDSGYVDAVPATRAYIEAVRRVGGEAREGTRVESIEVEGGKTRGVRVGGALLLCETVVLAAGPWSLALGRTAGIELPLEITREQGVVFDAGSGPALPCVVSSQVDRSYMRPAPEYGAGCLRAGRGYPKEYEQVDPNVYDPEVDGSFVDDVRRRVAGRVPRFEGMRRVGGVVGLYDVTPDWHPILGRTASVEGLVLATGGSGHSFKLAPAIGDLVAASVLEGEVRFADVETFSVERFTEGRELRSTYGGNRG
jgi:glycine/D-amino acid oxidase-like deaminating enzyme